MFKAEAQLKNKSKVLRLYSLSREGNRNRTTLRPASFSNKRPEINFMPFSLSKSTLLFRSSSGGDENLLEHLSSILEVLDNMIKSNLNK